MKINIIIDNKNNWLYDKALELVRKIKASGHSCFFTSSHEKVPKNSDVSFFLGCEKYISKQTRERSRYNIIIHAGDLPKDRGMSPTTWRILDGKNKIIVTLFKVGDDFDNGDYYFKDSFNLNGTELIGEWQGKLEQCMEKMIFKFIRDIRNLKPIKQAGRPTVCRRRTLRDSQLNISCSLKSQFNLLRVVDNERYPAFFIYKNKKYILKIFKEN